MLEYNYKSDMYPHDLAKMIYEQSWPLIEDQSADIVYYSFLSLMANVGYTYGLTLEQQKRTCFSALNEIYEHHESNYKDY